MNLNFIFGISAIVCLFFIGYTLWLVHKDNNEILSK
jgi:hypothetical protein